MYRQIEIEKVERLRIALKNKIAIKYASKNLNKYWTYLILLVT